MKNQLFLNQKYTALALVMAEIVAVVVPVILLGKYFQFPDILRAPAAKAFDLFRENKRIIVPSYYLFMISGLLFVPLSYYLEHIFSEKNALLIRLFLASGVLTAVFQVIGFSRWVFLMPFLTNQYFEEVESQKTISLIYETFNRYAGITIGEHLGFIVMGFWTILLALLQPLKKWLKWSGMAIGFLLIISVLEHFGGESAAFFGILNFLANTFWSFWLLAVGILVVLRKE
jgi:Domain of unknown function (DUF4386)